LRPYLMHIAIAGNIGVGKTTLARKLAEHYQGEVLYESVQDNPYLKDFYEDMDRWAFHLQIYFLNSRYQQGQYAQNQSQTIIQDRSIYEDAHIFAKTLYEDGHLCQRDYQNYLNIFHSLCRSLEAPDLLVYLRADLPKLKKHIQLRGRSYEQDIPDEYLIKLNNQYEKWINEYEVGPLLILDVNDKDFLYQTQDWKELITTLDPYLSVRL
ncbi:MAG: deoxynucleoside kinase, partial [Bacteroidota bacterium]